MTHSNMVQRIKTLLQILSAKLTGAVVAARLGHGEFWLSSLEVKIRCLCLMPQCGAALLILRSNRVQSECKAVCSALTT
jgi:hypothetical protein